MTADVRLLGALIDVLGIDLNLWKANGLKGIIVGTNYVSGAGGVPIPDWEKDWIRSLPAKGITPSIGVNLANYYALPVLVDWFNDAGWATLLTGWKQRIDDAKSCGVDTFHTDSEEYGSNAGNGAFAGDKGAYWQVRSTSATNGFTAYPHTAAEQCAKAYARGWSMGKLFVDNIPTVKFTHYYVKFPGGFNDLLQQRVNGRPPMQDNPMSSFFAGWISTGGKHMFANFDVDKNDQNTTGGWDVCLAQDRNSTVWLSSRIANWLAVSGNVSFGGACAISPIEDGVGPFKQAYSPSYVQAQLAAFAKANPIVILYEQQLGTFDYSSYFPGIRAIGSGTTTTGTVTIPVTDSQGNTVNASLPITLT